MQNGEQAEEGKEEGHARVQTHRCQARGPVLPPAPTCPGPAHLMQSLCKWLISCEVRRAPQSSLSRNWSSWISASLGRVRSKGWTRGSRGWGRVWGGGQAQAQAQVCASQGRVLAQV